MRENHQILQEVIEINFMFSKLATTIAGNMSQISEYFTKVYVLQKLSAESKISLIFSLPCSLLQTYG